MEQATTTDEGRQIQDGYLEQADIESDTSESGWRRDDIGSEEDNGDPMDALRPAIQVQKVTLTGIPLGHPNLAGALLNLADAYAMSNLLLGDEANLIASIMYLEAAVDCSSQDNPDLPDHLEKLGVLYTDLYEISDEIEDLEAALKFYKAAVGNHITGTSSHRHCLWGLSVSYLFHYHVLGNLGDLDASLGCLKRILVNTPLGHPELPACYQNMANLYQDHYQELGRFDDIEASLVYGKAGVASTLLNDPAHIICQLILAEAYTQRYQVLGTLEDLEDALQLRKEAVKNTPSDDPNLPSHQEDLGISYTHCYQRLGELHDLEFALQWKKKSVLNTSLGDPGLPSRLRNLGVSYSDSFQRFGRVDDLETALKCGNAAVDSTLPGHSALPGRQQSLAAIYTDRYQLLGDLDDLEAALKYDMAAVNGTPQSHPELASRQRNLAIAYTDQYHRLSDLNDLEASIVYGKAAVENTISGHAEFPNRQRSLAGSYLDRYLQLGKLEDLEATLTCSKSALERMPSNHPDYSICQLNLAISYTNLYARLGEMSDLESALQWNIAAIKNTPTDHPALSTRQQSLAHIYIDRYRRLGELNDLETAIQLNQAVVKNTPSESQDFASAQENLGDSYALRYEKLNELQDLEIALELNKQAACNIPIHDVRFPSCQQSLAAIYKHRYQRLNELHDLQAAINCEQAAINATHSGHTNLPSYQQSLAASYTMRYQQFGQLNDLDVALKLNQTAVDNASPGSPDLSTLQQSLAHLYETCYQQSNNINDHHKALYYAKLSISLPSPSPASTWNAAIYMAELHLSDNLSEALNGYKAAFSIIPQLLWIGSSLSARHENIIQHNIPTVTSSAVATATHLGDVTTAVEFLEQGLSITHQQSLQLKDHNMSLWNQYPQDADRLRGISSQLALKGNSKASSNQANAQINFSSLAIEREQLIKKIRTYDGFEDFLLPKSYEKLSYAAEKGPVIMLNCALTRCDAIIVLRPSSHAICVHLPKVSIEQVAQHLLSLRSALKQYDAVRHDPNRYGQPAHPAKPTPSQEIHMVLSWLWNSVVAPIFTVLNQNNVNNGRIWWCTSGLFNYLPLHAAAPFNSPFIQSYTSTLGGLIKAREPKAESTLNATKSLTVIGISQISDKPELNLPMVQNELKRVLSFWKDCKITQLVDSDASVNNVLKEMETSSWLHLACHGQQDPTNPLISGLLLSDGKLELGTILSADLPFAKFAFLSACETAMGDVQLVNEALHLTGGFIAAGFQGAIGTLWSMGDAEGPKVAEAVYQNIFKKGSPDVTLAAEGLHVAIQKLRSEGIPSYRWIPFVHFGI